RSSPSQRACARRKPRELRTSVDTSPARRPGDTSIAFAWPVKADRSRPWSSEVSARPTAAVEGNGPSEGWAATSARTVIPLQPPSSRIAQTGTSCRQSTSGESAHASRTISSRNALRSGGFALPWKRFQVRTSTGRQSRVLHVRVVLADPPAFTPPYDHELAAALARAGAEVELVTAPFRFGVAPTPDGYRRT